jgi:hypothetical protein
MHVAWVAKAHHVIERVRIVRISERADRLDVVDVKRLPAGVDSTATTRPTVTEARRSSASLPIGTIVGGVSAPPRRVLGALAVGVAASERAKRLSGHSTPSIAGVIERPSAVCARQRVESALALGPRGSRDNGRFTFCAIRVRFDDAAARSARRATRVVACRRAKVGPVFAPHMGWGTGESLAAGGALEVYRRGPSARAERIRARAGARCLPAEAKPPRVRLIASAARGTRSPHSPTISLRGGVGNQWDRR